MVPELLLMEDLNSLQQREVWFSFLSSTLGIPLFFWGCAGVQANAKWHYSEHFLSVTNQKAIRGAFGVKERLKGRRWGWAGSPTRSSLSSAKVGSASHKLSMSVCVFAGVCVGTVRSFCEVTYDSVVRNICLPTHYQTIKLTHIWQLCPLTNYFHLKLKAQTH